MLPQTNLLFLYLLRTSESGGQMTVGFIFWLLMLLWLILGIVWYRNTPTTTYIVAGGNLLIFILFFILGWATFGWPIVG